MKLHLARYFLTSFVVAVLAVGCAPKEEAATDETASTPPAAPEMRAADATPAPAAASTPAPASPAEAAHTEHLSPIQETPAGTPPAAADAQSGAEKALDAVKDAAHTVAEGVKEAANTVVAAATGSGDGLSGKVVYEGPAPKRPVLETEGDPKCHALHADKPLLSDREVVGADGGVQWAFAYIKNPPAGDHAVPADVLHMDQVACAYSPHVLGVRVGQKVAIKNSDPTLHNVRGIARSNKPFNFGQPEKSEARERIFDKPEMEIRLKCDIHSWMTGYIFAMEHPFFAVSDANGAFNITGLPAGEYTLAVWHESFGTQEVPVTVGADGKASVTVTFKPQA